MNQIPGHGTVKSMRGALGGKTPTTHLSPQVIEELCYAPLTSSKAESTFSTLNKILTVWKLNFSDEHLQWHLLLVAKWRVD